jgi:DNA-binding NarL/FixJ family response regulator
MIIIIDYHPITQRGIQVINGFNADQAIATQMLTWSKGPPSDESHAGDQSRIDSDISFGSQPAKLASTELNSLTIGLIDFYRLAQECLTKVLDDLHPEISIFSFTTLKDCITAARSDLDLIIYYLHGNEVSETSIMQTVSTICQAFPGIPVIIFSDADRMQQSKFMRAALKSGARGFVPTQTASLPITLAAIRFVNAGGTFVPVDLLLTTRPDRTPGRQNRLTSRQVAVLGHLQQGKANKIIAYELGMSESTVKVHVRNIMRKMGATNRTQAAYKAQRLSNDFENTRTVEV